MSRSFGWLPDLPKLPGEKADFDFAALSLRAEAAQASLRPFVVSILDQGDLGSCVTNSGFQAIRISHVRQASSGDPAAAIMLARSNPPELGSRLWGYYFARAIHHMTGLDAGTHLRSFFQAITNIGFPPESAWPYSDQKDGPKPPYKRQPGGEAFRLAFDQKAPTTYRRIFSTGYQRIADIKAAVANGFAVCFGVDVDERFADGDFDPTVPLDPPAGPIAGGHALTVVGYDSDSFDVVNSWGADWGDGGYFAATADFLLAGRDLWTVEHAPRYPAEL